MWQKGPYAKFHMEKNLKLDSDLENAKIFKNLFNVITLHVLVTKL